MPIPSSSPAAQPTTWLAKLHQGVEHPLTQNWIMVLIILNAVVLGLETSPTLMGRFGPWLLAIDQAILAIFVVEIAARLLVHRRACLRLRWCWA